MKFFLQTLLLIFVLSLPSFVCPSQVMANKASTDLVWHKDNFNWSLQNQLLANQEETSFVGEGILRENHKADTDFLICLGLIFFLGIFKQVHPFYFRNVFLAFGNASMNSRQLREQLQQSYFPGLLLDFLFFISVGFFLYRLILYFGIDSFSPQEGAIIQILSLAGLIAIIYFIRFVSLKIIGWAFQIKEGMDYYAFNIFLFNRIFGILLIPLSIVVTFGGSMWQQIAFFLAMLLAVLFYFVRFIRSRKALVKFLRFSKFHFILYLCASEILPMLVFIKLISSRIIG